MKKRLLSLALCLTLCLGLLPVGVLATDGGGVYEPPGTSTGAGGGVYEDTHPVTVISGEKETGYASIIEAFNNVADGGTIRLNNNITLETSLEVSKKNITLDLNGYVLGSNGSLTVKSGAALTVTNAGGEKSENPIKVGLYLNLLVEKGGSFTCTDGKISSLGLLSESTDDYNIKLVEGENHCTFGSFVQGDTNATVADLLKANPGMALHADNDGSDVRIARDTPINSLSYFSFYVGACSEHKMGADGTCDYCGASYVASVTVGGTTTNYTSFLDAVNASNAIKDECKLTMLADTEITNKNIPSIKSFLTLDLNGYTITNKVTQVLLYVYSPANVTICDSSTQHTGRMVNESTSSPQVINLQSGNLTITGGTFESAGYLGYALNIQGNQDDTLNIEGGTFIGRVDIPGGTYAIPTSISGGTFTNLSVWWSPLSSVLAKGHGFKTETAWLTGDELAGEHAYNVSVSKASDLSMNVTANKEEYSYGNSINLTAELSGLDANESVTYQWYQIDTSEHTVTKISGAENTTYTPSENLVPNNGDQYYTFYCAATCGDYAVGDSVRFTVSKADLSNATVTITNPEQLVFQPNPGSSNQSTGIAIDCKNHIKVTLPNGTEVPSNSYTVTGNVASSAGKHTLTIQGQDSCYTGSKSIEWTILPFKLTEPALLSIIKDYDGTTDLPELALHEFYHNDPSAGSLITLNQGTDFTVEGKFDSAEVGSRTATLTFHLLNQNYSFADGSDTLVCGASTTSSISIRILEATPVGAPTLSKSALTYGETLSAITLSGSMKNNASNEPVEGTFTWVEPNAKPDTTENYVTKWIFTPKDSTHYKAVGGEVSITVNKATPTGTPKYTAITTNGKTLKDAALTAEGGTFSVPGHVQWVDEKGDEIDVNDVNTEVKANTAYTWKFTPYDENYTPLTGTITLWHKSSSSGSSGSVTPGTKTDTMKNPDGSTTKTETKADGSKTETTTASSGGGSTGTTVTKTDAKGNTTTEASAKLSDRDVKEAQEKGKAVTVPVKEIEAAKDANAAAKIKIDVPNNADKTTVEIPVENVTSGTVAVIVHEDGTEELVKDSKPTEGGVQLELSGSTTVKIIDNSKTFDDTKDHWSRDEVNFVAARELFNGVGGNQFGVSQPMTRGMVNTVLARLAGVDTTPSQGQAWYEVGTDWAKKNGISDGTDPTAPVTREQLATLLYRYAGSPSVSGTLHAADAASVSDYAKDALLWANQNGIVNGVGSNTIAPKDNAQRAQVAAMLARYLQNQ